MKKTSKLLAFVIAFSMILSTVVFPVSVNAEDASNLIVNGDMSEGFESLSYPSGSYVVENNTVVTDVMFDENNAVTEEESEAVNKAIKLTLSDSVKTAGSNGKYPVQFLRLNLADRNAYYYVAADAMSAEPDAAAASKYVNFRGYDYSSSIMKRVLLSDTEWTKCQAVVNAVKSPYAYLQVPADNTKAPVDHYMDNLEIRKIEFLSTTTDVPTSGTIQIAGPEALELKASGISFSDGLNSVAASDVSYEDEVWTISYAGLAGLTEYTLTINNTIGLSLSDANALKYTFTTKDSNLLKNGDFEALNVGDNAGNQNDGATAVIVGSETTTAQSGEKCVKITNRNTTYGGLRFVSVPVTYGQAYRFTAYAKLTQASDNPPEFSALVEHPKAVNFKWDNHKISADEWTKFTIDFAIREEDCDPTDKRQSVHIGLHSSNKTVDLYVDNFSLVPIGLPALTTTFDIENNATDVALDKEFVVEWSNPVGRLDSLKSIVSLTSANFTIDNGAQIDSVTRNATNKYTVKLKGLENGKTYNLGFADVRDFFGQTPSEVLTFTTAGTAQVELPNLLEGKTDLVYYSTINGTHNGEDVTQTAGAAVPYDSAEGAWRIDKINQSSTQRVRFVSLPGFEHNQMYMLELKAKYVNPAPAGTTRSGGFRLSIEGQAGVNGKDAVNPKNAVTDEYTTFRLIGRVTNSNATADGEAIGRTHVGVFVDAKDDIYIKDFVMKEYIPFNVTASMEDGATEVETATDINVAFDSKPVSFTEENVVLRKGSEIVTGKVTVTATDDKNYVISLAGLEEDTTYSLSFENVKDMYSQEAIWSISFKTKNSRPQPMPGLINGLGGFAYSDGGKWSVMADYTTVKPVDGVYTLTAQAGSDVTKGFRFVSIPQNVNKSYIMTAYVKDGNLEDGNTPVVTGAHNGHSCLEVAFDGAGATNVPAGEDWTKVSYIVNVSDKGSHKDDKTLCGAHSSKGPIIGTAQGATYQGVMHLGFNFKTETGDVLLVKDVSLREYIPFTIESSIENGATKVDADKDLILTITNKLYKFSEENVVLSDANGVLDGKVSVKAVDDTTYALSFNGLELGAKYTLELVNVEDIYAQAVDYKVTFTTDISYNILARNGRDYSYENGAAVTTEGTITTEIVSRGEGMPAAVDGVKYLKATGISGSGRVRFNNIGVGKAVQLESGRTYEVSYWVRTLPDDKGDETTANASLYFSKASVATNTIAPISSVNYGAEITSGKWTKVSATVTIGENPDLTDPSKVQYAGIHIGLTVSGTSAVYVDSWDMREVIPEFKLTSSVADGTNNVKTNTVNLTFTTAPQAFDESNIIVEGADSFTLDKLADTIYRVTLDDSMKFGRSYKITIKDVKDNYGQIITDEVYAFTLAPEPVISDKNIVANAKLGYYGTITGTYNGEEVTQTQNAAVPYNEEDGTWRIDELVTASAYNQGARAINIAGFDANKAYKFTIDFKFADEAEEGQTRAGTIMASLEGNSGVGYTTIESQNMSVTDEWQTFTHVFKFSALPSGRYPHIGIRTNANDDILLKNFSIVEYALPFEASTSIETGATNVETDTEFDVSFSSVPWNFDINNVEVKAGDTVITSGIAVEKTDDKNYKIVLTELNLATTYTVNFVNVVDVSGTELTAAPVVFTTSMSSNILEYFGADYSFENGKGFGIMEGTGTPAVVKASDVGLKAPKGENILKISGRSNGSKYRYNSIGLATDFRFEAGKQYILTFYARTGADAEGNATSDKIGAFVSVASPATNTIIPSNTASSGTIDITNGGWTKVSYIIKVAENPYTGTPAYASFHIGAVANGNSDLYLDHFVLKEYVPTFTAEITPANGTASYSSSVVTYTFTNAPTNFDVSNVAVTNGATVEKVNKVSDTVYTVMLGNLEYSTEYTVSVAGILDSYGQPYNKEITFTTSTGNPAADNNKMNTVDFSFENSYPEGSYYGTAHGGAGEKFTVVNAAEEGIEAYHGNQVLKIETTGPDGQAISHRVNNFAKVELDKTYVISYYARTVDPSQSVTASMMLSRSGVTSNLVTIQSVSSTKAILTGEWARVTATVKIIKNPECTSANPINQGFHFGVQADGVSIYVDNYEVLEVPSEELHITSSTPGANTDGVAIDVGEIVLNYSSTLSADFNPAADGVVKLLQGDTDVTESLVESVETGFGNGNVIIKVGELKNNTQYKLVLSGVTDYMGRTIETEEIVFKTISAIDTVGAMLLDSEGNALDLESVTAADVVSAKINITNASSSEINSPVFIYTVYDSQTGDFVKSGSTAFAGTVGVGEEQTLELDFGGEDFTGKTLTLYLINSYDNLSLAASPIVKEF